MNEAGFRAVALGMPGAIEGEHMGHADFRVGGKIFATLGYPDESWGMVKVTPEEQAEFMAEAPGYSSRARGRGGAGGRRACG
ncbi:MAG: MmcQ/YjbR family DNA-binding protein [Phycisphaerales bacterium]